VANYRFPGTTGYSRVRRVYVPLQVGNAHAIRLHALPFFNPRNVSALINASTAPAVRHAARHKKPHYNRTATKRRNDQRKKYRSYRIAGKRYAATSYLTTFNFTAPHKMTNTYN